MGHVITIVAADTPGIIINVTQVIVARNIVGMTTRGGIAVGLIIQVIVESVVAVTQIVQVMITVESIKA